DLVAVCLAGAGAERLLVAVESDAAGGVAAAVTDVELADDVAAAELGAVLDDRLGHDRPAHAVRSGYSSHVRPSSSRPAAFFPTLAKRRPRSLRTPVRANASHSSSVRSFPSGVSIRS